MTQKYQILKRNDHDKYIITSEFNKLTTENFNARLAEANLITKTDFDTRLSKRITSNKTKHLLTENELKKLERLMEPVLEAKITLMMMAHKII